MRPLACDRDGAPPLGTGAMILLAIETATPQVAVAVGDNDGPIATFSSTRGRRHAETLVPAVEMVLGEAGLSMADVGGVAVDVGPGLFTGLRVGVAAAKALGQARRVGLVGITSLDLLAYPMRHTDRTIVPAVDARRGEVFWALYRRVAGGVQRLTPYRVCPPEDLANELLARDEECVVVGDGALRHAGRVAVEPRIEVGKPSTAYPSPSALLELAHPRMLREDFVTPAELSPLYLRQPDVAIHWEQRRSTGPGRELTGT